MAKSLEEIEAAFRNQYQKDKKNPEEEIKEEKVEKAAMKEAITEEGEGESKVTETVTEKKPEKAGRAAIISDIIFYFALIAMVVCAVLFSRGAFGTQTFGGYRFYEVLTTSMESVYPRGSLVLIKKTEASELVVGDDITFAKDSSNLITHRIIEIKEDYEGSGKRAFVTKGVDNATADADVVLADNVMGKVTKGIPRMGAALSWIGSNLWLIIVLFLSLMAFSFFIKIFWRESKKEKIKKN
ncbi:signal peptidase I [Aequitasia blattaphilus]|uniref:Signal peptidase I n=1 Tax=Aequitasia blattaphilus TaxID=2949332 RepID=A0ABT1E9A9_9FIRM|nr:signal peptidase I [Aequitasia blattaphilus]MCP1102418.1 signal peptidase I [Aequitasia blattaphilus]MCR8615058.1 signal peptidase I [Aequitasia blattaphilus]